MKYIKKFENISFDQELNDKRYNLIKNIPTKSSNDWYKKYYDEILNILDSIQELKN